MSCGSNAVLEEFMLPKINSLLLKILTYTDNNSTTENVSIKYCLIPALIQIEKRIIIHIHTAQSSCTVILFFPPSLFLSMVTDNSSGFLTCRQNLKSLNRVQWSSVSVVKGWKTLRLWNCGLKLVQSMIHACANILKWISSLQLFGYLVACDDWYIQFAYSGTLLLYALRKR